MFRLSPLVTRLVASLAIAALSASAAVAQSFAPVAQVNEGVITAWELQQRQRMLTVLNAPPEVVADALQSLVNERIQLQAAAELDVTVGDAAIEAGIEDFAARGNLSGEQFLTLLAREGIDQTTIRDFVRAGLAWRDAVRARFGDEVRITEDQIERAREEVRADEGPRVLLSEIILPAGNELERIDSRALAEDISRIGSIEAFSAQARQHSTADSADDGGRIGWIPLEELEGPVANAIQGLRPGQVTDPINVPNGIALFQLRATRDGPPPAGDVVLDYAQLLIPGGRSQSALQEAARIDARVDPCDDLYEVAGAGLVREERPVSQIPADLRAQLAGLDRHEISTALTRGDALVFLMLCDRDPSGEIAIADTAISAQLNNEELTQRARIWLEELKAQSYVRLGGE